MQLGSFAVTIILLPRHLDLSARKRRERKRERILRKWPVGSMPLPTDPYHDDNTTFFLFCFLPSNLSNLIRNWVPRIYQATKNLLTHLSRILRDLQISRCSKRRICFWSLFSSTSRQLGNDVIQVLVLRVRSILF